MQFKIGWSEKTTFSERRHLSEDLKQGETVCVSGRILFLTLKQVCSRSIGVARRAGAVSEVDSGVMRSDLYRRKLTTQGLQAWVGLGFSF